LVNIQFEFWFMKFRWDRVSLIRKAKVEQNTENCKRVLIIYTGGTIGMKQTDDGYAPESGWLEQQIRSIYAFQDPSQPARVTPKSKFGSRIKYDIIEYDPLLDSANMETHHWVQISKDIVANYDRYDGFVVLHGTDTMSYTASALSFMLVNLRKTVVLTGSQIPLSEVRNDAVSNLLGAMTMAGLYEIPEVCLYFDHQLFRGNRTRKFDTSGLGAFRSWNLQPLAKVGVDIDVSWHLIRAAPARPLSLRIIKEQNVVALRLFPGISTELFRSFLQPPVRGVVLETYGAGNVPATRQDFLDVLQEASARGVIIVNCTQCALGTVSNDYAAGSILKSVGVVTGNDMTPESALTKLAYLLSQEELTVKQIKNYLKKDMRGELTQQQDVRRFSFQEQQFVETIAKVLTQGEQLGINQDLSNVMFPVLMCSAASRGDIEAVERMLKSNVNIDIGDYDGRTCLHLAAAEGQLEMVDFLIEQGADIHVLDRWGTTPISDAVRHGKDDVVQLLKQSGARLDQSKVVSEMCNAASLGDLSTLRRLIDVGVDPSLGDYDRRTPLHLAAAGGHVDAVRYLLSQGADPKSEDRWGGIPLDDAQRYNWKEVILLLV
jgi:60kDa lysophospholipase